MLRPRPQASQRDGLPVKEAQAVAYNRRMGRLSGRFEVSLLFAMLSFGASLAIIVMAPALRVLPGISEAQTTTDWSLSLLVVSLLSFLSSVSIRKWLRPPTSSKLERLMRAAGTMTFVIGLGCFTIAIGLLLQLALMAVTHSLNN